MDGGVALLEPSGVIALIRAIASADDDEVLRALQRTPALAREAAEAGASRRESAPYFLDEVGHYIYAGDTALHGAAAAYRPDVAKRLISLGAAVGARNRRGAQPLHYAADGNPESAHWNPTRQAATIALLIRAGADPNAIDKSGVAPLHRAVRTRSAAAVRALLAGGADPGLKNGNGSTAVDLATRDTGRGGSGSPAARRQQSDIIRLLGA